MCYSTKSCKFYILISTDLYTLYPLQIVLFGVVLINGFFKHTLPVVDWVDHISASLAFFLRNYSLLCLCHLSRSYAICVCPFAVI